MKSKDYRVLFLTNQYLPLPKVCEICIKNVREALFKMGIKSDVLQFAGDEGIVEIKPMGNVYSIGCGISKMAILDKNKIDRFWRRAKVVYRWPLRYRYSQNKKYRKTINKLCYEHKYDVVIGFPWPADLAVASIGLNNFILYELDVLGNNPLIKGTVKKIFRYRIKSIEKKLYESASLIIHMEFFRDYFSQSKFLKYSDKTVYADIPNLLPLKRVNVVKEDAIIKCVYFGSLVKNMRDPNYLLKVIKAVSEEISLQCEFYTRGDCEDILQEASLCEPKVIKHNGYVSHEKVIRIQNDTDFLLSIGNSLTGDDRSLPSKTIEYISTGKPIIHINGGINDSAITYLKKYGSACIIDPKDDFIDNVHKVKAFIRSTKGKRLEFAEIEEKFYKNTPEYTANIIKDYIVNNVER